MENSKYDGTRQSWAPMDHYVYLPEEYFMMWKKIFIIKYQVITARHSNVYTLSPIK